MTQEEMAKYDDVEELRKHIMSLQGRKFRLDCGHHVTFGHFLGNDIVVLNGKVPQIICSCCGH